MNVSVVILNWNGEKYLNEFLPILLNNLDNVPDAEIVVADNGSTDSSLQLLAEKFPTVKVDAFEKNYGFAGGYNKALKNINSEYYVLLNSDVEVTKDWLSTLYEFMTKMVIPQSIYDCSQIPTFEDPKTLVTKTEIDILITNILNECKAKMPENKDQTKQRQDENSHTYSRCADRITRHQ